MNTGGGMEMETVAQPPPPRPAVRGGANGQHRPKRRGNAFQMPLHYPRYTRAEYEAMPEWKLDCLLSEYGLPVVDGDVKQKREFAMGAFLWSQY